MAPSELLLLLDLFTNHLVDVEVRIGFVACLDLLLPLHKTEDLHVPLALSLAIILKLGKLLVALLLKDLLGVGCVGLVLADLFIEFAHGGGGKLGELETLVESLSFSLLDGLLSNFFVDRFATLGSGGVFLVVGEDLSHTLEGGLSVLSLKCMHFILDLSQFSFLLLKLLLILLESKGIGALILRLVLLEPVMLSLDLLLAVGTPSWHPVLGDLVENEARALLSRREALLLSEFLPLGLGFLLGGGFRSRSHDLRVRKVHTVESLRVFENLPIVTLLGFLLPLEIEELLE